MFVEAMRNIEHRNKCYIWIWNSQISCYYSLCFCYLDFADDRIFGCYADVDEHKDCTLQELDCWKEWEDWGICHRPDHICGSGGVRYRKKFADCSAVKSLHQSCQERWVSKIYWCESAGLKGHIPVSQSSILLSNIYKTYSLKIIVASLVRNLNIFFLNNGLMTYSAVAHGWLWLDVFLISINDFYYMGFELITTGLLTPRP